MPCYEEDAFFDYLRDKMSPKIIDDFERHILDECDECAARLHRCHLKLERLADEVFLKRTLDLLNRLDDMPAQD